MGNVIVFIVEITFPECSVRKEWEMYLRQWFSNFSLYQNHLEGLLKIQITGPHLQSLILSVWSRAQVTHLTSFQVMLIMLVRRQYFETWK